MKTAAGAAALAVALATLVPGLPAGAADAVPAGWETVSDGDHLSDTTGRIAVSSRVVNVNAPETVVVAGGAAKPAALQAVGVDDVDVVASAFHAGTGEALWSTRFDGGVEVDDDAVALENSTNNNLVFMTVNSGADAVVLSHPMNVFGDSDTAFSEVVRSPGAVANDSAISPAGGFMGIVGRQAGRFYVRTFGTGALDRDLGLVDTAVAGEGLSADVVPVDTAPIGVTRTMLVTGRETAFGNGGDLYTAAYDYRSFTKLWERRWASPAGKVDEGSIARAVWSRATQRAIGFVAGRTLAANGTWDIVVTAYDLTTGAPLWGEGDAGVRTFDGEDGLDDEPVAVEYADSTGTVYVAGTTDRPAPHGDDAVVLAYDALTGERRALAYAGGGAGNGADTATGLDISPDGSRVVVSAEVDDIGARRAALFAFDALLHPAGEARLADGAGGGAGRAAGAFVTLDGTRAVLVGSSDQGVPTGHDHHAAAFPTAAFEVAPVPTALAFTPESAVRGQHTDTAAIEVRLSAPEGALAGRQVALALGEESRTVATDGDGIARATFTLTGAPGTTTASASYLGDGDYVGATASAPFAVEREDTVLTLTVGGKGSKRVLTARLADADTPSSGVAGRSVTFAGNGVPIGTGVTGADGTARISAPASARTPFTATFAGDPSFLESSA